MHHYLHPSTLQESLKTNDAGQSVINQRRQQKKARGCQNVIAAALPLPRPSSIATEVIVQEIQSSRATILPGDSGASIVRMDARISIFLIPMCLFKGRFYQYLHSSSLIWGLIVSLTMFSNVFLLLFLMYMYVYICMYLFCLGKLPRCVPVSSSGEQGQFLLRLTQNETK